MHQSGHLKPKIQMSVICETSTLLYIIMVRGEGNQYTKKEMVITILISMENKISVMIKVILTGKRVIKQLIKITIASIRMIITLMSIQPRSFLEIFHAPLLVSPERRL